MIRVSVGRTLTGGCVYLLHNILGRCGCWDTHQTCLAICYWTTKKLLIMTSFQTKISGTIHYFMWYENLHKFHIENLNVEKFMFKVFLTTGSQRGDLRGLCSVEDLRLTDFHIVTLDKCFEILLANIRVLTRFVFVSNFSPVFEGLAEHGRASIHGIPHGLIRHTASVEELVLSPSDGTYGGCLLSERYFDHCFTNLRSVAVPICLLLQDIARRPPCLLPSTVEEVQIQFTMSAESPEESDQTDSTRDEEVAAVEWMAKAKLVSLPELKRVIWWYQPCELNGPETCVGVEGNPFDGFLPELRRLGARFDDVQVSFEWVFARFFKETPFGRRLNE